ncbi:MAG TPA: extracellular solute-binding protein, partial [Polyangiaceae bacterium]|nr:extracellular solute-binding protein [Polyangiaceae bacterium]
GVGAAPAGGAVAGVGAAPVAVAPATVGVVVAPGPAAAPATGVVVAPGPVAAPAAGAVPEVKPATPELVHQFDFGSYGRAIGSINSRGNGTRNADIMLLTNGSRLDESSYTELEFRRTDEWLLPNATQPIKTRILITPAIGGDVFHYTGKFSASMAVRNLAAEVKGIGHPGLLLWAGSRMYRGDDIFVLDFWPLDNLNTIGGGAKLELPSLTKIALHWGVHRIDDPFLNQQVTRPLPLGRPGTTQVSLLDRPRAISSLRVEQGLALAGKATMKFVGYSELHYINGGRQQQVDPTADPAVTPQPSGPITALPSDSGYVIGAQIGWSLGERATFANLVVRYARGLAAYQDLVVPFERTPEGTTDGAREARVALWNNYEVGPIAVMSAALARSFRTAVPDKQSYQGVDEAVFITRPHFFFTEAVGVFLEGTLELQRRLAGAKADGSQRTVSGNLWRIGVVPFVSPTGKGTFARPQIRAIYHMSVRDSGARSYYAKDDPFSRHSVEHFFGLGVEWWYNYQNLATAPAARRRARALRPPPTPKKRVFVTMHIARLLHRRLTRALALAALALAAGGCGDGSKSQSPPTATAQSSAQPAPAAAPAKQANITIKTPAPAVPNAAEVKKFKGAQITFYGDPVSGGLDEAMAAKFSEDTGVEVRVIPRPKDPTESYAMYKRFFQGKSADVDVLMLDVIWPGAFAENLLDLGPKLGEAAKANAASIVENNTVGGKLVAMPFFTDFPVLYYRSDLLQKYGFAKPPETWDELERQAKKIQEGEKAQNPNFAGFVWQGKAYEGLTCNALEWVFSHGGGQILDGKKPAVNNPQVAKALARAKGWVGGISPAGVTGYEEEDARNVFQGGNAAFMRNWPYAYAAGNSDGSPIKGKFDVTPLPHEPGQKSGATIGGWQLGVSKYSKSADAAVEFVRYLTSPEGQKFRAINGSFLPTLPAVQQDPEVTQAIPFIGRAKDVSLVARPAAATGDRYNEVSIAFFQGVSQALQGKDPTKILPEVEQRMQRALR